MKKRKISDSDTNEIQSGKVESKKCFLKSVPKRKMFSMYRFVFYVSIEFYAELFTVMFK